MKIVPAAPTVVHIETTCTSELVKLIHLFVMNQICRNTANVIDFANVKISKLPWVNRPVARCCTFCKKWVRWDHLEGWRDKGVCEVTKRSKSLVMTFLSVTECFSHPSKFFSSQLSWTQERKYLVRLSRSFQILDWEPRKNICGQNLKRQLSRERAADVAASSSAESNVCSANLNLWDNFQYLSEQIHKKYNEQGNKVRRRIRNSYLFKRDKQIGLNCARSLNLASRTGLVRWEMWIRTSGLAWKTHKTRQMFSRSS